MVGKEALLDRVIAEGRGITYDDVKLQTGPSDVSPREVDISSRFSTNVELRVPLVSAAMDTVTESAMAIAMAKAGGIGVIHAGLSIEDQKREVRKAKLHLNGLIERPITVSPDQTIQDVLDMCDERGFDFRSFPVVDEENRMLGLLTGSDINFSRDKSLDSTYRMMRPIEEVVKAPSGIEIEEAFQIMEKGRKKILPLLDEYGRIDGMYIASDVLRVINGNPDEYNLDEDGQLRVAAAVPTDPEEAIERIAAMKDYLDVAVIDTAQGDSNYSFQTLKAVKENFSDIDVVVGNITSGESAALLALNGADGIKIGQGPGSICTTRVETGIGCPQVTAIYTCVQAIKKLVINREIPVCADGGINNSGDIPVALAVGADSVMMGRRLAGTKETPGSVVEVNGKLMKGYRGMGSEGALKDSSASRKRYGIGNNQRKPLAEGVETRVAFRGSVADQLNHDIQALKKGLSYVGAPNIKQHQRKTGLWIISAASVRESHPHDINVITA